MGDPLGLPSLVVPLQLSTAELVLLVSDYVTIAVGLVIAYIAYRGYRRNDSRPMLYVATGFVLVFGGPGAIFLVSLVAPIPSLVTAGLTQFVELVGMAVMLYGFVKPVRT